MAIFSMNNEDYEDNELFDESGDILDNMLEACDQMLDALGESTAAQRHFKYDSNSQYKFNNDNHPYRPGSPKHDIADVAFYHSGLYRDIDKKNIEDFKNDQFAKGKNGARLRKYAKSGIPVKDTYDKAHKYFENIKKDEDKKKAIKETCLTILSMIDDI